MYMTWIFFEKIGTSLFFLVAGTTDTKVRHSTGVTNANSTNKDPKANKLIWAINYLLMNPGRSSASKEIFVCVEIVPATNI